MKKNVIRIISVVICLLFILTACKTAPAPAQTPAAPSAPAAPAKPEAPKLDFPKKPITLIVDKAAGGSTDVTARAFTQKGEQYFGKAFVIENVAGAGGAIAWNKGLEAAPDGYTLNMTGVSTATQTVIDPQSKYNYPKEFKGVGQITSFSHLLVVPGDAKYKTLAEFVTAAKAAPKSINYGFSGLGNPSHVMGEVFQKAAGIQLEAVPFNSGSELITGILGNHLNAAILSPIDVISHVKAGKMKVLALGALERSKVADYKDWPTFIEQGYQVTSISRMGISCSNKVPADVYKYLCDKFMELAKDKDTLAALEKAGAEVAITDGPTYTKALQDDQTAFAKRVVDTGVDKILAAQKK